MFKPGTYALAIEWSISNGKSKSFIPDTEQTQEKKSVMSLKRT